MPQNDRELSRRGGLRRETDEKAAFHQSPPAGLDRLGGVPGQARGPKEEA
jgi:hypothetical protein